MRLHILQPEMKQSPVAWCEKSSAAAEDVNSESKWKKHDHLHFSNPPMLFTAPADRRIHATFQAALWWLV